MLRRTTTMIRVRGENLRSWDFVMGMDGSDEDLQARWDEVKDLYLEMADSIRLFDAGAKTKKTAKKTANKKRSRHHRSGFHCPEGCIKKIHRT